MQFVARQDLDLSESAVSKERIHKQKGDAKRAAPLIARRPSLDVVVQREFVRMRPQAHCIGFVLMLVSDVSFEQFFGEHIAL